MAYTHRLTRWFHKRLAHNYTQAGVINPYSIKMSTILRDSGTYQSPRPHDNVRRIDEALDELKADKVLQSSTAEVQRGPGIDHGIGHFMLVEVAAKVRALAPPSPKSRQTSSAASDRKSALRLSSHQAE